MHKTLIKKIVHSGKPEDMEHLEDLMIYVIDRLMVSDHSAYKKIEHKLYRLVYGEHLNDELAHKWVAKMENKDGTRGEHWTIEQTSQYADTHNKYDWYAVMNMVYSDYFNPKFDLATYLQLAKDWIDDVDIGKGKTLRYYFDVVCHE